MIQPDPEILEIFREEAGERLDRMVATLLALESGHAPPDAVDSLFRDAHSIKGSAGMVGMAEVQAIAHTMEDSSRSPRDERRLRAGADGPLLQATDALRRTVARGRPRRPHGPSDAGPGPARRGDPAQRPPRRDRCACRRGRSIACSTPWERPCCTAAASSTCWPTAPPAPTTSGSRPSWATGGAAQRAPALGHPDAHGPAQLDHGSVPAGRPGPRSHAPEAGGARGRAAPRRSWTA